MVCILQVLDRIPSPFPPGHTDKCINDPVNIAFLLDKLEEYGFEANDEQAECVLGRCSDQLNKLRKGQDLSYSDEITIESSSTFVMSDLSEKEIEAYSAAVTDALENIVYSEEEQEDVLSR